MIIKLILQKYEPLLRQIAQEEASKKSMIIAEKYVGNALNGGLNDNKDIVETLERTPRTYAKISLGTFDKKEMTIDLGHIVFSHPNISLFTPAMAREFVQDLRAVATAATEKKLQDLLYEIRNDLHAGSAAYAA